MRVQSVDMNIVDGNIGLEEFLNIDDIRMRAIGINLPFQRKRILHGLLQFHHHKFKKSLMAFQAPIDAPLQIYDYFNELAKCLKYLVVMRSSLKFIQREDLFGHCEWVLTDEAKKHIVDINDMAVSIDMELQKLIVGVKKVKFLY